MSAREHDPGEVLAVGESKGVRYGTAAAESGGRVFESFALVEEDGDHPLGSVDRQD